MLPPNIPPLACFGSIPNNSPVCRHNAIPLCLFVPVRGIIASAPASPIIPKCGLLIIPPIAFFLTNFKSLLSMLGLIAPAMPY